MWLWNTLNQGESDPIHPFKLLSMSKAWSTCLINHRRVASRDMALWLTATHPRMRDLQSKDSPFTRSMKTPTPSLTTKQAPSRRSRPATLACSFTSDRRDGIISISTENHTSRTTWLRETRLTLMNLRCQAIPSNNNLLDPAL